MKRIYILFLCVSLISYNILPDEAVLNQPTVVADVSPIQKYLNEILIILNDSKSTLNDSFTKMREYCNLIKSEIATKADANEYDLNGKLASDMLVDRLENFAKNYKGTVLSISSSLREELIKLETEMKSDVKNLKLNTYLYDELNKSFESSKKRSTIELITMGNLLMRKIKEFQKIR